MEENKKSWGGKRPGSGGKRGRVSLKIKTKDLRCEPKEHGQWLITYRTQTYKQDGKAVGIFDLKTEFLLLHETVLNESILKQVLFLIRKINKKIG